MQSVEGRMQLWEPQRRRGRTMHMDMVVWGGCVCVCLCDGRRDMSNVKRAGRRRGQRAADKTD